MAILQYSLRVATSALRLKWSNNSSFPVSLSLFSIFVMRLSVITFLRLSLSRLCLATTTSKNSSSCFARTCDAATREARSSTNAHSQQNYWYFKLCWITSDISDVSCSSIDSCSCTQLHRCSLLWCLTYQSLSVYLFLVSEPLHVIQLYTQASLEIVIF